MDNVEEINLFEIIELNKLLEEHALKDFNLIDFSIGYDDMVYLLFSRPSEKRIYNHIENTKAYFYTAVVISVDWENMCLIYAQSYPLGIQQLDCGFLRPYDNGFLLLQRRCWNYSDGPEKNALVVNQEGTKRKEFCLGDGIEDCITTQDKEIITSYFDEGVFGNRGWNNPIGEPGIIVWNEQGQPVWKNTKYFICDCYAICIGDKNTLYFYYYNEFELVRTNYRKEMRNASHADFVFDIDIYGSPGFAVNRRQNQFIFQGGYNDYTNFYLYDCFDWEKHKLTNKRKINFTRGDETFIPKECSLLSSKLIFLSEDNKFYGYHFL